MKNKLLTTTPNTKPKMTVKQRIMQKLLAGETISPLTALQDFGCLSLSQRISELRAKGEPIKGEMVYLPNGKKYKRYWIEPQDQKPVSKLDKTLVLETC